MEARIKRLLSLTLAVFLISDTLGAQQGLTTKEIKFGSTLPLTGQYPEIGRAVRLGLEYAIDEANRVGGIKGRKITVIFKDNGGNAQQAYDNIKILADFDKVYALVGSIYPGSFGKIITEKPIVLDFLSHSVSVPPDKEFGIFNAKIIRLPSHYIPFIQATSTDQLALKPESRDSPLLLGLNKEEISFINQIKQKLPNQEPVTSWHAYGYSAAKGLINLLSKSEGFTLNEVSKVLDQEKGFIPFFDPTITLDKRRRSEILAERPEACSKLCGASECCVNKQCSKACSIKPDLSK